MLAEDEWDLGARDSSWTLEIAGQPAVARHHGDVALRKVNELAGEKVRRATVSPDSSLSLAFGPSALLSIFAPPPASPSEEDELPSWEIFMPENRLLSAYAGGRIVSEPSDVPMS
jgi:hypothetical protein